MAPPDRNIVSDVSGMPDRVREDVRVGFALATSLPSETLMSIVDVFLQGFQKGGAFVDLVPLAEIAAKPRSEVVDLVAAISVLLGLISKGPISETDIAALQGENLFREQDAATVSAIAKRIAAREP